MGTITNVDRVAKLLFGSVRRDLLAVIFGRPDERFYVRELVRVAGGGSGAVQRELRELSDAGLVVRESVGRQVFYSANRAAPIYPELQGIVAKTAGVADVLRGELSSLIATDRIVLAFVYGSVAAGRQTAKSDVDLIVIGRAKLAELMPGARAASERLGRDVNPSVYAAAEFRAKARSKRSFLTRVLSGPKIFVVGDVRELERLVR
jgi:predicted nucleotidyltransferase